MWLRNSNCMCCCRQQKICCNAIAIAVNLLVVTQVNVLAPVVL
jgi:hypothetical protein